jgi:SulP family sulfate permease
MIRLNTSHIRGDIFGGLTAGIVALPLALAFGEASGAGPIAGLWGAIIVGFFAALFGGTETQVSGPTGPMVVVFAGIFASLSGNVALVFTAVVLAGVLQILFGVFKLGQYIRLVPYPVVSGFMSGIGCIIIALQLARLFGHEPDGGGTIPALTAVPAAVMDPNMAALAISGITLFIIFMWPKKWSRMVPGPLAALVLGTVSSLFITGAPVLGEIATGFPSFVLPTLSRDSIAVVLEGAFILAVLGAIDSLLTSLVADNMTRTRHESDKELIGQGIGNTIAGLFGAIPGAGATMRTVINIRTGAVTKISGMIHALVLVAVVISLAPLASRIPHAVLAGILVKVGYDIVDFEYLKRAHRGPRWDLILMALVLGLTVFVDLITAVGVGVVLASLAFVKDLADDQLAAFGEPLPRVTTEEERDLIAAAQGRITMFEFGGPLSFGAAADLGHRVRERVKAGTGAVILDFSRVPFIDISAVRAVETIAHDAIHDGKWVYATGMNAAVGDVLRGLEADKHFTADMKFEHRIDALRQAVEKIQQATKKSAAAA